MTYLRMKKRRRTSHSRASRIEMGKEGEKPLWKRAGIGLRLPPMPKKPNAVKRWLEMKRRLEQAPERLAEAAMLESKWRGVPNVSIECNDSMYRRSRKPLQGGLPGLGKRR